MGTLEEVLKEYGVISREEAQALINKRMDELHKADEARVADNSEKFGDDSRLTSQDLQQILPDDIWKTVRQYLATEGEDVEASEDMDVEPEGDVEKAVYGAIGTSEKLLFTAKAFTLIRCYQPVERLDDHYQYYYRSRSLYSLERCVLQQ